MEKQELWCKAGGHFYHREPTRGRKPISCPVHRENIQPQPESATATQVLRCKAGHEWERPPQRGRKPEWCSEHQPQVEVSEKRTRTQDDPLPPRFTVIPLTEIQSRYRVDPESARVFAYIEQQIGSGQRELTDLSRLMETYRHRLRFVSRGQYRDEAEELEELSV